MNDLTGLDWSSSQSSGKSNSQQQQPNSSKPTYTYPSLQPTPSPSGSGRSTPLAFNALQNTGGSGKVLRPGSKPPTPANDSFASLLKPSASKGQGTLSLQDRQRQIQEEKAKQEEERRRKLAAQYGGDGAFWDGMGQQKAASPPPAPPSGLSSSINRPFANINRVTKSPEPREDDDILAAFNSSAPVDASSHFPPPQSVASRGGTPSNLDKPAQSSLPPQASSNGGFDFNDDDDPFGLGQMQRRPVVAASAPVGSADDDDILGMLGRPVSEAPRPSTQSLRSSKPRSPSPQHDELDAQSHPQAKAVSELVDMGFPADKAADALAQTDSGTNVQAAVSILLNQAHGEAKQKSKGGVDRPARARQEPRRDRPQSREPAGDSGLPAWMRGETARDRSGSRPGEGRSSAQEKDIAKQAQDIGASLFKSANSLWKQGQKKVQKAMSELQQEGDSSQPKWMREAQIQESATQRRQTPDRAPRNESRVEADITNEAMLLEGGGRPPKPPRSADISRSSTPASTGSWNDIPDDMLSAPRPRSRPAPSNRSAQRLTRQDVEASAEEVFVSSRRRRPAPAPATQDGSGLSTLPAEPSSQSRNPFSSRSPAPPPQTSKPATPIPTRPKAPPRNVPSVSNLALQNSSKQRTSGSEAFKRGDYATAHTHYTSSLQGIPHTHPIAIIIFCNRALTSLKNGDPRAALSDADSALSTIGVSRGEGERIALGGNDGEKEMKEFYGKALMRKAEALENLEKWSDAAQVWRAAVEAGVGGAVAVQGRNRCENASRRGTSQQSASKPKAAARKPPPKPASALATLSGSSGMDSEAVRRMRAANAAAEKADDEKFALTDLVDAKLVAWKGTKADNLRALLGSLDKVLWPEAGWNKVGMQDLVMPNKVKIIYMKAIAKVHPDKISTSATTEQRMISAAVFATLNEAWDKFKTDNGL